MTQRAANYPIDPASTSGTELATILDGDQTAELSMHSGGTRPSYAVAGTEWMKTVSGTQWEIYVYDGANDILIGTIDPVANTWMPSGTVAIPDALLRDGSTVMDGNLVTRYANPEAIIDTTGAGETATLIFQEQGVTQWKVTKAANNSLEFSDTSGTVLTLDAVLSKLNSSLSLTLDNATVTADATTGNPAFWCKAAGVNRGAIFAAGTTLTINGYNTAGDTVVGGIQIEPDGDVLVRNVAGSTILTVGATEVTSDKPINVPGGHTTAGFITDSSDVGIVTGTVVPDFSISQLQLWQPNGSFTIDQPTADGGMEVYFDPSADGTITAGSGMALIGSGDFLGASNYVLNIRRFGSGNGVMNLVEIV